MESIDTCIDVSVVLRVFACPCEFSCVAVSVTPYSTVKK